MAVWQFDLELMPSSVAIDPSRYVEAANTDGGLETKDWWVQNQPSYGLVEAISNHFALIDSWSKDIVRFGSEDAVLIELFTENGLVVGVAARIDLRHLTPPPLIALLKLSSYLRCKFFVMETQAIVEPIMAELVPQIEKSRAAKFCRDPEAYLAEVIRDQMS